MVNVTIMPRTELPQYVPSGVCQTCDVCCHFPEADSFLRPYFMQDEIAAGQTAGIPAAHFPNLSGGQIDLVPDPTGVGYLCPAFDPANSRCSVYESRPLDCRLYPLALMWDAARQKVMLGWDRKCPFMVEALPPDIAAHAERVSALLATDETIDRIAAHPQLIGRFQDDVVVIKEVPRLTARLTSPNARLSPLVPEDAPRFAEALKRAGLLAPDTLAAYAFPYHCMWMATLPYWWMEGEETFYLFARSPDGWFMPLPPLGPKPLARSVADAFSLMEQWNGHSPVSRIESVMEKQKRELSRAGYRFASTGGDYLYGARALAALMGDGYKSQRALCNRLEREQSVVVRPYRASDEAGCRSLYERWAAQKRAGQLDSLGRLCLDDSHSPHMTVFARHETFALSGTVVVIGDAIAAYTFGYWLTPQTFCVLLEVADRSIPGLAQYLFREICRTAVAQGAQYINAMDDGGLASLRDAKQAYRPMKVIGSWIITGL